jgi:hypothetical protein
MQNAPGLAPRALANEKFDGTADSHEPSKSRRPNQENLTFEIEGVNRDTREGFSLWRLGILRRVRQEELRKARGFNPDHEQKMQALRAEWVRFKQAYRVAAWGMPT